MVIVGKGSESFEQYVLPKETNTYVYVSIQSNTPAYSILAEVYNTSAAEHDVPQPCH